MYVDRLICRMRPLCLLAVAFVAASCVDRAPSGLRESSSQRASLSVQPTFQSIPPGGPTIPLSKVTGVLQSPNGETVTAEATFQDGTATLSFNVQLTGPLDFKLELTAFDQHEASVYHAQSTVHVVPGESSTPASPPLEYSAPDASVQTIVAAPNPINLDAGASVVATVTGTGANGQPISPIRVGWTSRDPAIATVDDDGTVHAGLLQGTTWIVARAVNNVADSIPVKVRGQVAKIVFLPAAVSVIRGKIATFAVQLFDAGDHLIDDRVATLSIADQSKAQIVEGGIGGVAIGTTTLTASIEGKSATATITVLSPVDHIDLTPGTVTLVSIDQSQNLTATVVARTGASVDGLVPTFSSSNPAVATVDAAGKVTAKANGTATMTAQIDNVASTAAVVVAQVAAELRVQAVATQIRVGEVTGVFAQTYDATGHLIGSVNPAWNTNAAAIATVSTAGTVTGLSVGTARITGTLNALSGFVDVQVLTAANLTLIPSTTEKLPGGTQQFLVTVGGAGPYIWSVRGLDAGSSTYGTITADGFYTAPGTVPELPTFDVCARRSAAPAERGCATVTIKPVPTSGADIIVFNDINFVDYGGETNIPFFKNLINFTGNGPRASQSGFLVYRGNGSKCQLEGYCLANGWEDPLRNAVVDAGFSVIDQSTTTDRLTSGIAANVKAIMLLNPTVPFSNAEVNALKQFAGEGGRVIFVGEHFAYYGSTNPSLNYINLVENTFLQKMGAVLRNPGNTGANQGTGVYACPGAVTGTGIKPHQLTTGITQVYFACSSEVVLGLNDYAVLTYNDQGADRVLVAVAKIDLTPLPPDGGQNLIPLGFRGSNSSIPAVPPSSPPAGAGAPGWKPRLP